MQYGSDDFPTQIDIQSSNWSDKLWRPFCLFLIVTSVLSSLVRMDYNIALGMCGFFFVNRPRDEIYAFRPHQTGKFFWICVLSVIVDFVWVVVYSDYSNKLTDSKERDYKGTWIFAWVLTMIYFLLKLPMLYFIWVFKKRRIQTLGFYTEGFSTAGSNDRFTDGFLHSSHDGPVGRDSFDDDPSYRHDFGFDPKGNEEFDFGNIGKNNLGGLLSAETQYQPNAPEAQQHVLKREDKSPYQSVLYQQPKPEKAKPDLNDILADERRSSQSNRPDVGAILGKSRSLDEDESPPVPQARKSFEDILADERRTSQTNRPDLSAILGKSSSFDEDESPPEPKKDRKKSFEDILADERRSSQSNRPDLSAILGSNSGIEIDIDETTEPQTKPRKQPDSSLEAILASERRSSQMSQGPSDLTSILDPSMENSRLGDPPLLAGEPVRRKKGEKKNLDDILADERRSSESSRPDLSSILSSTPQDDSDEKDIGGDANEEPEVHANYQRRRSRKTYNRPDFSQLRPH